MSDPAVIAVLLIVIVVCIGVLVHLVLEQRIQRATLRPRLQEYRFECTCGWSGWRSFMSRPNAIKCTNCNGVAVQLDYRGREE